MRSGESASTGWLLRTGGCVAVIVFVFYLASLWLARAFGPLKELGRGVQCQDNLRQLVRAQRMYADDYGDRFPPASQWVDRVDFYLDKGKRDPRYCPEVGAPGRTFGYGMNGHLGGKERSRIDEIEKVPLLFDSPDLTKSAASKGVRLPQPGRHVGHEKGQPLSRGNYVGLAGGGARFRPDPK